MVYLSFSQTAGIRYPRMPMCVYNLDGPFLIDDNENLLKTQFKNNGKDLSILDVRSRACKNVPFTEFPNVRICFVCLTYPLVLELREMRVTILSGGL